MTIPPGALPALSRRMYDTLTTAQTERRHRQNIINGELEWVRHERQTMHTAVNQARAEHGKPPVPLNAVEHAEDLASGHSDYTRKFAFYCAELVFQGWVE